MKINWQVRIKNPVFWLTIIPAAATFVYAILGAFGIIPPISEDVLVNALSAIITALATLGVLVDPTTKGAGDSDRAMSYTKPN
jgi:phi LC3 family holin